MKLCTFSLMFKKVSKIFSQVHIYTRQAKSDCTHRRERNSSRGLPSDSLYFVTSLRVTHVQEEIGSDFLLLHFANFFPLFSLSFTHGHLAGVSTAISSPPSPLRFFPDEIFSLQLRQANPSLTFDINSFIPGRVSSWLVYGTFNIFSKFILTY